MLIRSLCFIVFTNLDRVNIVLSNRFSFRDGGFMNKASATSRSVATRVGDASWPFRVRPPECPGGYVRCTTNKAKAGCRAG